MYCQHCGSQLPPGAKFCPNCGNNIAPTVNGSGNYVKADDLPYMPPQAGQVPHVQVQAAEGNQIRPWVRYWARMMDILVFSLPMGVVLAVLWPELLASTDPASEWVLGLIIFLAWAFVEPLCLSVFGTTPGKALFRITLRLRSGQQLEYSTALRRSLKVWLKGMGMGLPLVGLITVIVAYNKLKRLGSTSWDAEGGFDVLHRPVGTGRIMAAIGIFLLFILVVGAGS